MFGQKKRLYALGMLDKNWLTIDRFRRDPAIFGFLKLYSAQGRSVTLQSYHFLVTMLMYFSIKALALESMVFYKGEISMVEKSKQVYRFKVTLSVIKPKVWRQIQVPEDYTFWDLHVAIHDAMGWMENRLHLYRVINPKTNKKEMIGIPEDVYNKKQVCSKTLAGWKLNIRDYFIDGYNNEISYLYDFDDKWEHVIQFEGVYPVDTCKKYPLCLAGKCICPPEDAGGVEGYKYFMGMVDDAGCDAEDMLESTGGFDFSKFDPKGVRFKDPKKCLENLSFPWLSKKA